MRKLLFLASLISLPLHAAVNAHVNTQTLNLGDALQLTIEADQKTKQNPDLSGLGLNFRVVGSKQMTISSYSNGERQFSTRWRVMLRPLRHGALTIPGISVGHETSLPISLTVLANERGASALLSQSLILETELDTNEIYIHSQAVLKVKFFHRNALPEGATLSKPITSDAVIKPLGEAKQYSAQLRGLSYQVLEQRYGIYPQHSGLIRFEQMGYNSGQPGSLDQVLQKTPVELAVLPKAHQRNPGYWLPAKSVSLQDNLQPRTQANLGVGLKRIITLEAHGILASELPALSPLKNELADIQLDNVTLEERITDSGIISTRTEELTITATERGEITLREIRIPWWDVSQDKEQEIRLAPKLVNVSAAQEKQVIVATQASTPEQQQVSADETSFPQESTDDMSLLIWLLTGLAVISSLGWLYTFNRMRNRRQKAMAEEQLESSETDDELDMVLVAELDSYKDLAMACTQNDCPASQLFLVEWARYFWPQEEIFSSEDIALAAESQTFELLLMDMEHHLDHGEEHLWQGDLLLEAINRIRERRMSNGDLYSSEHVLSS